MKFNIEKTVRFKNLLAKGSHIRLNDTLDSNNGVYMVIDMTEQQLDLMNVKTSKRLIIKATDDISRYSFDLGTMQFVPNENKSSNSQEAQETNQRITNEFFRDLLTGSNRFNFY